MGSRMRLRHRHRGSLLVLAAAAAAAAASAAAPASGGSRATLRPGPWCGGPLWRVLTLSDADRKKVVLKPTDTNIADIAALEPPVQVGSHRTTDFERHAWRLEVVVDRYRIGADGEIALVLYSIPQNLYMNAYLPNPRCLSARTRDRAHLVAARKELIDHCAQVTPSWQLLGISARITGVGFWNPRTDTRGALPNGAELRPIIDFQIVSGCGVP
jgi:hypothetical protein